MSDLEAAYEAVEKLLDEDLWEVYDQPMTREQIRAHRIVDAALATLGERLYTVTVEEDDHRPQLPTWYRLVEVWPNE